MGTRIEDYGLIGNARSAALVSRDGSIDWLCMPRFDSEAFFASLLGDSRNGHWSIAPSAESHHSRRRYREGTAILETSFECDGGTATLIDFMPTPVDDQQLDLVRLVRCDRGSLRMHTEIAFRFGYGRTMPWVRRRSYGLTAVAGPDQLQLRTPVHLSGKDFAHCGEFTVSAGQVVPFVLSWHPSHRQSIVFREPDDMLRTTETGWRLWTNRANVQGPYRDAVIRSLITLKMLTYFPTGGIVAAATTSLPEEIGGMRNWDYRFCWIRDATLTLYALMAGGYREEAHAWREWLLRAAAGKPDEMQIMYGVAGERHLQERELPWLKGYEGSAPVRIGNLAHSQLQLDVYGELMDAFYTAEKLDLEANSDAWALQRTLLDFLEGAWTRPDAGIWEMRGQPQHFTHSKAMAWVAFDRAIKMAHPSTADGPVDRWTAIRDEIHREICQRGFDSELNSFVQSYGSKELDAALLLLPQVGFLPAHDPRIRGTIDAVRHCLQVDGLIRRYRPRCVDDGLAGSEGAFLACTFWLADALALLGEHEEARLLFERLLAYRNDLGLLSEEYDPINGRFLGNFPQAFSHVAMINTAQNLVKLRGPAEKRQE
jgi:GH15 family glucan-1,4-alpha-glucosidase